VKKRTAAIFAMFCASLFFSLSLRGADGETSYRILGEAILADRHFEVTRFHRDGAIGEVATNGNKDYIVRAPGPAFLALPFLAVGRALEPAGADPRLDLVCGAGSNVMTLFFSAVVAALMLLLCTACRRASGSRWLAGALTFVFTFCFITDEYSSVYNRHALCAWLVLAAMLAADKLRRAPDDRSALCALAFCVGLLPLCDYFATVAAIALACLALPFAAANRRRPAVLAVALALLAVGPAILAAYQGVCFGAPWRTGYAAFEGQTWVNSLSGAFMGSMAGGLRFLLFNAGTIPRDIAARTGFPDNFVNYYVRQRFDGLFVAAPILCLALPGWFVAWRDKAGRWSQACLTAAVVATVALIATFRTPFGGASFDVRYIYHVTPIFFVWTAGALGWLREKSGARRSAATALLTALVLAAGSRGFWLAFQKHGLRTVRQSEICPNLLPPNASLTEVLMPNLHNAGQCALVLLAFWLLVLLIWTRLSKCTETVE